MMNATLLLKTISNIENGQADWHQASYGRRRNDHEYGCFAFWTLKYSDEFTVWFDELGYAYAFGPGEYEYSIEVGARLALGLTPEQAEDLFDATNSLLDLQRLVQQFIEGESELQAS